MMTTGCIPWSDDPTVSLPAIASLTSLTNILIKSVHSAWPEPYRRRHLLRLWLRDPAGRPLPKEQQGSRSDRSVQIQGLKMIAPLDVETAAE
jgi:hypothetical protein